ncbi:anthrone oxygenase family protein, partial [Chitinophaga sancti]|uniref:anthrone oxygenase family protein n=1 Tax=Chitinophaga sancti TaxID=1004 RepID=UPI003F79E1D2
LLLATLSYYLGVMAVTILENIPLNNMLEAFTIQGAGVDELHLMRAQFEQKWNMLNHIRTLCSPASFILVMI